MSNTGALFSLILSLMLADTVVLGKDKGDYKALSEQSNVFNSPINTSAALADQLDDILSEITGDRLSLQGSSLSDKIAQAVSLNLFEKIKDPIMTEEELIKRSDEAFQANESKIRAKDTKQYFEDVHKLVDKFVLSKYLSDMDLLEPIKIDHKKLLNQMQEQVEKKYDVTNDYPDEVKSQYGKNLQGIVNHLKSYIQDFDIKTILTRDFSQLVA